MSREEIANEYIHWMKDVVYDKQYSSKPYSKLFEYLYSTDFTWTIPMDCNRADEGIDLRYSFGEVYGLKEPEIADALDYRDCSVLEMMVALAMHCETNIMGDPQGTDNTGCWFWSMICNLGLESMTDDNFDLEYTNWVIKRFLDRQYEPDGTGGLFTVKNCRRDMRGVEIWYQLCWYLDEILYAS